LLKYLQKVSRYNIVKKKEKKRKKKKRKKKKKREEKETSFTDGAKIA